MVSYPKVTLIEKVANWIGGVFAALVASTSVRLTMYDVMGRRRILVEAEQPAGRNTVVWDGRDVQGQAVASGMYFYRLEAGSLAASRTMLLVKYPIVNLRG